jgi:type III secretory pathway component EscS
MTEVALVFGLLFSTVKVIHQITKDGLGYILGDFFLQTNLVTLLGLFSNEISGFTVNQLKSR